MATPSEHDFIEKCKHLIECRLEWANSSEWKNRDYEYLSELISEKTKISISISTLKRIWKNNKQRVPHVSTLNAFGLFLDYDNWNDFKTKLKNEIRPANEQEKQIPGKHHNRLKLIFIASSGIILITSAVLLVNRDQKKANSHAILNKKDIVFTSKKTVTSGLPNTVVFNYDISKTNADSAFIQQDWDKRKRKKVSKDNHYHTSIYYYPGFFTAQLALNDQIVIKFPLFVTTDGWMAVYKKTLKQEIPVYLKNITLIKDKALRVSVEDLETNKIRNDKDFYISYYNGRDFGNIYCDNFSFETEIKNDPKDGGLTCQYTTIILQGEEGIMSASFAEKGCTSQLSLRFSNVFIDGSKNDLSAFGTDLTHWRKIKYKVVNKNIEIFVDNKQIHQLSFERNIGKIIGISYHFYGCGAVKLTKLYDQTGRVVYEDIFGK